jgi:hypothetical protein
LTWIGSVERGRFAQVVLPKDIDGIGLLQLLSVSRLNDLFASSASNKARNQKEGKLMMMIMMMILMMMMMMINQSRLDSKGAVKLLYSCD